MPELTSTRANYTIPELTSDQYQTLLNALVAAETFYQERIKNDPAFEELTEATDPDEFLKQLIEDPKLLPDETPEGEDTCEINELIWEIRGFRELSRILEALPSHCAGCGKVTADIGTVIGHGPALCDACLDAQD